MGNLGLLGAMTAQFEIAKCAKKIVKYIQNDHGRYEGFSCFDTNGFIQNPLIISG